MNIRPYETKDYCYVRDVCLSEYCAKTEPNPTNRALICAAHCDYYLDCEPEFCFVAVNEQDIPFGYIFCSANMDNYVEQMDEQYLPLVRKISGTDFFRHSAELKWEQKFAKNGYTSHIHFFVGGSGDYEPVDDEDTDEDADAAQASVAVDKNELWLDTSGALFDAMLAKLKESYVEGAYVICGEKDAFTRKFLENYGFVDADYLNGAVVYAKKLFSEEE